MVFAKFFDFRGLTSRTILAWARGCTYVFGGETLGLMRLEGDRMTCTLRNSKNLDSFTMRGQGKETSLYNMLLTIFGTILESKINLHLLWSLTTYLSGIYVTAQKGAICN